MKKIKKAVIPAAGFGTRFLPYTKAMPKEMLPIVDKPTIQYIVEEAVASGIEEILIITSAHSNKRSIEDHFDKSETLETILLAKGKTAELKEIQDISTMAKIFYTRQRDARGLGDAIYHAKAFVGDEPFAVLLGDDIIVSDIPVTKQLMNAFAETNSSIMGVQKVGMDEVQKYGVVAVEDKESSLTKMIDFIEKPNPVDAPSDMAVLGRYILTPEIFDYLESQEPGAGNEIQLTDAVKRMMANHSVYACNFTGCRYDIGDKFGFLKATIDFALDRDDLKDKIKDHCSKFLE